MVVHQACGQDVALINDPFYGPPPPAAPATCENLDKLPDVTFIVMGTPITMKKEDYVMFGASAVLPIA